MTDFDKYSSSIPPELVLTQLIQDLEKLTASSQEKLSTLKTNIDLQKHEPEITVAFFENVRILVELYFIVESYLNERLVNPQDYTDKGKSVSESSLIEILQTFTHEARHPISSLQGLTTFIETDSYSSVQTEILQMFDGVLNIMKIICYRLSDIMKSD